MDMISICKLGMICLFINLADWFEIFENIAAPKLHQILSVAFSPVWIAGPQLA